MPSIKIVSDYVDKPEFYAQCDDTRCKISINGAMDATDEKTVTDSQNEFIANARKLGWIIGLDGVRCPGHHKRMREAVEARKRFVDLKAHSDQAPAQEKQQLVQVATQMPRKRG